MDRNPGRWDSWDKMHTTCSLMQSESIKDIMFSLQWLSYIRVSLNLTRWIVLDIVAYRPVARKWPCKHQPLIGDSRKQRWSGVTIRDAYSRCYGALVVYACAVMSDNSIRGEAGGIFCRSAPKLYDSIDRVLLSEWVQYSWGFSCGVLISGQRMRNNLHC
jgi:hypothetical protein